MAAFSPAGVYVNLHDRALPAGPPPPPPPPPAAAHNAREKEEAEERAFFEREDEEDLATFSEFIRLALEVTCACLTSHNMQHNTHLLYWLLHRQQLLVAFQRNEYLAAPVNMLMALLAALESALRIGQLNDTSVDSVLALMADAAKQGPCRNAGGALGHTATRTRIPHARARTYTRHTTFGTLVGHTTEVTLGTNGDTQVHTRALARPLQARCPCRMPCCLRPPTATKSRTTPPSSSCPTSGAWCTTQASYRGSPMAS